tara:strand:- start:95 stop:418 length:324 start_codon:yes stop_codon:yes gene_type:complete
MKKLIYIFLFLFGLTINAQELKLLHINAKWNQSNNYKLKGIQNCIVQYALLEDQTLSIRQQIKSVPVIILIDKKGKPRGQWKAGLNFKILVPKEEIQARVNVIYNEK